MVNGLPAKCSKEANNSETAVSHPALSRNPMSETAARLAPRAHYLIAIALAMFGMAFYLPNPKAGLLLLLFGLTLLIASALILFLSRRRLRLQSNLYQSISAFVELDASPSFTTDLDGKIGYRNKAAIERFGAANQETLIATLGNIFASPMATLHRLQNKASVSGSAREDVVMRRGHLRLSVHRIGENGFLWRLEDMLERAHSRRSSDGISLPMLTIGKSGTILYMNEAFRRLINGRETKLDRVFNDLPLVSGQNHEIASPDGPINCQVSIVEGAAGRKEVFLLPVAPNVQQNSKTREPLDALPVALLRVAPTGEILNCNNLACALLGIEAPKGKYLGEMVEGLGRGVTDWPTAIPDVRNPRRVVLWSAFSITQPPPVRK